MKKRKAIVSGGSSGIGKAIAEAMATEGAEVAIADINSLESSDFRHHFFKCDVSSGKDIDSLFSSVTGAIGDPDIIVCNAGTGVLEKLSEGDPEKWQKIINTNLMGTLRLLRAFLPGMKVKGGDVVFISSVSAFKATPYNGVYGATKVGIDMIAETLRLEELPKVRVLTIYPGVVDTRFAYNSLSESPTPEDLGYGCIPPEEIGKAVVNAITSPTNISYNQIVIRPTLQPF